MNVFRFFGLAALLGGCQPERASFPACSNVPSLPDTGLTIDKPIKLIGELSQLTWISSHDGHAYQIVDDPARPVDLGPANALIGPLWDETYWYRPTCYEDCDDPTSIGPPIAIERINRKTGTSVRLTAGEPGVSGIVELGDYLYVGTTAHHTVGKVLRVSKSSGHSESTSLTQDQVQSLVPYQNRGVLVSGYRSVVWIPHDQRFGREIFRSHTFLGAAVLDETHVYIAEEGRAYDDIDGSIYRLSIHAGDLQRLVGSLAQPTAIAARGSNVFFMMRNIGSIWSVPKAGGDARTIIVGAAYDEEHGEVSLGLWAHTCGLVWLHGNSAPGLFKTLKYLPWSTIQSE